MWEELLNAVCLITEGKKMDSYMQADAGKC